MRGHGGPVGSASRRMFLLLGLVALIAPPTLAQEPAPKPAEPSPPHERMKGLELGTGRRSYWLFEPDDPRPTARVPLIVFNHGWLSMNPAIYGAWIRHLVRHGNIVVFPRYQADWTTPSGTFLPNALAAVRDALEVCEHAPGRARPDPDRFALIGHSAGGNLAAQLAAVAEESGLPTPRALICVTPGEVIPSARPDLAAIDHRTTLLVIAAEDDLVVGDGRARQIYRLASRVPPERKEYVLFRTDRHGTPPLVADHFLSTAALPELDSGEGPARLLQLEAATVDPLDTVILWRMVDATLKAGFADEPLDASAPFIAALRDVGTWSDGRPVRGPLYGDDLDAIPRVRTPHGLRLVPWPALPAPNDGPLTETIDALGRRGLRLPARANDR